MLGADLAECVITLSWQNKETMTTAKSLWQPQRSLERIIAHQSLSKRTSLSATKKEKPFRICLACNIGLLTSKPCSRAKEAASWNNNNNNNKKAVNYKVLDNKAITYLEGASGSPLLQSYLSLATCKPFSYLHWNDPWGVTARTCQCLSHMMEIKCRFSPSWAMSGWTMRIKHVHHG